jgi:hypothetical protein
MVVYGVVSGRRIENRQAGRLKDNKWCCFPMFLNRSGAAVEGNSTAVVGDVRRRLPLHVQDH